MFRSEYCSPGWKYFKGSCYFFSTTSKSWDDAQTHCTSSSANLVNIGSKKENDFIAAHIKSNSWIGLKEVPGNGMNWTDDNTAPGYAMWQPGQPVYEENRVDCTSFSTSSGKWYTVGCDEELNFVCEKGKINVWSSAPKYE